MTTKELSDKAMRLCSRREYSGKEIFEKIISWGCTSKEAQNIVDSLVHQKFIDDRRYAEAYAKDKLRFNGWGRIKILYMLRLHGIDESIIRESLTNIDEKEYDRILKNELSKKLKSLRLTDKFETRSRLFRFAASRGFESELVNEVLSKKDFT